ncbi:MAG: FHA domain-containing protein [Sarcina sp.]
MSFMLYKKDERFLSYLLKDNNDFFDVGYKVLKSESNRNFIECFRTKLNGRIKLMYDISSYKSCEEFLVLETKEQVIKMIINILKVVAKVRDNGFIEFSSIETSVEKIFLNTNNLEVKMIYLPVNLPVTLTEEEFIKKLKLSIIDCIRNNLTCKGIIMDIIAILNENNNINETVQRLLQANTISKGALEYKKRKELYEKNMRLQEERERIEKELREEKKGKGIFSIFSRNKNKKNNIDNDMERVIQAEQRQAVNLVVEREEQYVLSSLSTSKPLNLIINKREFLIGSKAGLVDGLVNINNLVSRRHCIVKKGVNGYYIVDNGSSNGTFINGRRLEANISNKLADGDIVKVANVEFVFKRM